MKYEDLIKTIEQKVSERDADERSGEL
jgi:hypothetical protein